MLLQIPEMDLNRELPNTSQLYEKSLLQWMSIMDGFSVYEPMLAALPGRIEKAREIQAVSATSI